MNAHPMPPLPRCSARHSLAAPRRLTMGLLLLWGLLVFVPVYFARELSWTLMGWPLSFWLASQLFCLLGFVTIVHRLRAPHGAAGRRSPAQRRKAADLGRQQGRLVVVQHVPGVGQHPALQLCDLGQPAFEVLAPVAPAPPAQHLGVGALDHSVGAVMARQQASTSAAR